MKNNKLVSKDLSDLRIKANKLFRNLPPESLQCLDKGELIQKIEKLKADRIFLELVVKESFGFDIVIPELDGNGKHLDIMLNLNPIQYSIDHINTSIALCSADKKYLYANKKYADMFSLNPEDIVGKKTEEIIGKDSFRVAEPYMDKCLLGTTVEYDLYLPDKDNYNTILLVNYSPVCEKNRNVIGFLASIYNITKQRESEILLRESEWRFRETLENLQLAAVQLDTKGKVIYCNDYLCRLTGYTINEITGSNWFSKFVPEIRPDVQETFLRSMKDGNIITLYENEIRAKSGELYNIKWNNSLLRDKNHNVIGTTSIGENVTDAYKNKAEIIASELRFTNTFEQAAVGIAHVGLDGKWLKINKRICEIVGYKENELLNLTFQDITHPDDLNLDLENLHDLLEGKINTYRLEKRYIRKNGSIVWVNLTVSLVRTQNNDPDYFISVVQDISDKKDAERKINELNNTLENRVKERTAQLESANKELEAFAYSVSHDLRSPLRAIDGFSKIMLEEYEKDLDDEGKRLLAVIRTNTQKMDGLITDLLSLSRVSRIDFDYSFINMTDLVNSVYNEIVINSTRQNFDFIVKPLKNVKGDAVLLKQVWVNLISNAVKFTSPKNERRIEITSSEEENKIIYCIKDTGVGFNSKYKHKLFGLFQRLHTAAEFEGTGVGLAIVQRIIHRHKGQVWADGTVNKGAIFCFSLPVSDN